MLRKVIIKPRAERVIQSVANFIEAKNTPGSSDKWVNEIMDFIISHAYVNSGYSLCTNADLAKRNYSCIVFKKKWVIAFKQTAQIFEVYQIVYGPNLG